MDIRRLLGGNIRRIRLLAELSQDQLAARMDVEQAYISRLEAGALNPTLATIGETASALQVAPAALFEPLTTESKVGSRKKRL